MIADAPIIDIADVTRDYASDGVLRHGRTVNVIRGVSLAIAQGEILGLVGESGCGKSTLSRLILGIEPPTSGAIHVDGQPVSSYRRLQRARLIQPVFQDPYSSLNPRKSIGATILAPLDIQAQGNRRSRRARAHELLQSVGLPEHLFDAYPRQLSGGQRQRVAVARALAVRPKILICDEPTSALDVSVQAQVLNLIASLKQQLDLTIVFISHDLAVVNHLAHRVAIMSEGQIIEYGTTDDIFLRPSQPYTRRLLGAMLTPEPGKHLPDIGP